MFTAVLKRACSTAVVSLLFMCSGCYITDQEIFSASEAVTIPGLAGDYHLDDGGNLTISATSGSHDYRFRDSDGAGSFRCIPFYKNIYIVQAKYDDETNYNLLFERITNNGSGCSWEEVTDHADEINQLAEKHHVSCSDEDWLSGTRENIRNFLYAHKNLGWE